jgi:hypothetical protein
VSWDVVLLAFRDRDLVPFDAEEARRIVLATEGARETEPYVAELVGDSVVDIYYGSESPEILLSIRAYSPHVTGLIFELARGLEMTVFFPARNGWGAAYVEGTTGRELPDKSWVGWQDFDDDFEPPDPVVCHDVAELEAALDRPYGDWAAWAQRA